MLLRLMFTGNSTVGRCTNSYARLDKNYFGFTFCLFEVCRRNRSSLGCLIGGIVVVSQKGLIKNVLPPESSEKRMEHQENCMISSANGSQGREKISDT